MRVVTQPIFRLLLLRLFLRSEFRRRSKRRTPTQLLSVRTTRLRDKEVLYVLSLKDSAP